MRKILYIFLLANFVTFAQSPGGVSTSGMSLWLSADDNVSDTDGGTLDWQTNFVGGYDAYQLNSDGQKPKQTELFNFHKTFTFDGSNDYLAIEGLNYVSTDNISDVYAFVVYKTDFENSVYNSNWAFIDFDRSDAYDFYVHGDGRLGMSYREGSSTGGLTNGVSDLEAVTESNDDIPHIGTFIINNSTTNRAQMRLDGDLDFDVASPGNVDLANATRYGFIGDGSEANSEDGGRNNAYYDGEIAEIILFDKSAITADEVNQIESYLALKYGITLNSSGGGNAGDYLYYNSTTTTTIWDASANSAYHNNVAGIIRADNYDLHKRVTKAESGELILATSNDYTSENNDVTRTSSLPDESALIYGSSSSLAITSLGLTSFDGTRSIYNKNWLFKETGETGIINIAIPTNSFPSARTVELIVSSDDTFDGSDAISSPSTNGDYYYWSVNINDGEYITFLEGISPYDSPGGVSTSNMALWLSADSNVTDSGTLTWSDKIADLANGDSGNDAAQDASGEKPTQTNLFNFNQSFAFDGTNDNFSIQSLNFPAATTISDMHTFVVYKTAISGAGSGDNWSLLDFDRSDVFNFNVRGDNGFLRVSYPENGIINDNNITDFDGVTASNTDIPHLGVFSFDSSLTNDTSIRLNGSIENEADQITGDITTRAIRYGFIGGGSEANDQTDNFSGGPFEGDIAEVIFLYNSGINTNDIKRVESYLALKYGITLDVANGSYTNADGDILWNNTDYWNNVAGLINDGPLNQRIATPVSETAIIVATNNNYTLPNNDASRTALTDGDYLLFGDNGETGFDTSVILDDGLSTLNITRKQWLFKEGANDVGNVYIAIPTSNFPEGAGVKLVISNDETFDGTDTDGGVGVINGDYYEFNVNIADGQYIAFTSTESKIAGVSVTRYDMILRADQNLTNTGSAFSWTDASFNESNAYQNNAGNIPTTTEFMNFNPTLTFDGTSDYLTIANKHYDAGQEITDLHTYVAYKTDFNEEDGSEFNDNWSFYDFDRSEAFNMYIQPSGQLSFSYASGGLRDRNSASLGNDDLPHIAEFIFDADDTGATNNNNTKMKFDGNVEFDVDATTGPITVANTRYGFIGDGSEASSENGTRNNVYYDGQISEILLADREEFTAAETLQLESYLAIKYGITLNSNLLTYKNSQGTTIWDNTDYWHGVAGIIKDDEDSDIDQRVAQSTSSQDIIVATDLDFVSGNLDLVSRPTGLTEESSLIFGNNGAGTGFTVFTDGAATQYVTTRKWLFKEIEKTAGDIGAVHIAIEKGYFPTDAYDIQYVISSDDNFTFSDTPVTPTDDGTYYHFNIDINDGDRLAFTFTLDQIPSPGNVNTALSLSMWIKANKNVSSTGGIVTSIGDSSIGGNDVSQSTNLDKPSNNDLINYNPTLTFDGTSDDLAVGNLNFSSAGEITKMYSWVIYNTTSTDTDNGSFLSFKGDEYFDLSVEGADGNLNFSYATTAGSQSNTSTTATNDGSTKMAGFIHDNTLTNETIIRLNGSEDFSGDVDDNAIGTGTNTRFGYIGDNSIATTFDGGESGNYYDGEIAEVIYYQGQTLSAVEIQRVESYLAIKYGITLDASDGGVAGDYLDSEGNTIWDASDNLAYNYGVFAIGQDSNSELLQKQSFSQVANAILSVSIDGSVATTNELNGGSFDDDLDFLFISNNSDGKQIADICGTSIIKINRDWKVRNIGSVGTVTLSFDLSGVSSPANYSLLIDGDLDGDFSTGTPVTPTGTLTGSTLVYTGLSLVDGQVFTLQSSSLSSGQITYIGGIWTGGTGTGGAPSSLDSDKSIVVSENVTLAEDANCQCLNIVSGAVVTVPTNTYLEISNNMQLEGDLYLEGTAELIQTATIDNNSGSGEVYKIVDGLTESGYRFDYVTSPVNTSGTYNISDNMKISNDATDLSDNTDISFISTDSDGFGTTLSSSWFYTLNHLTDYTKIDENTALNPGVGFTMKGSNQANSYNFIGSPNNGNITALTIADGDFATVGNPYPSGLDAGTFNTDMLASNITTGIVYLWDQPTGNSHLQDQYDGGYATINSSGVGAAASGVSGASTPDTEIKPAQGFTVEGGTTGGDVIFTNSMRSSALAVTTFFKTSKASSLNSIVRLGFEFESEKGTYHRELVITPRDYGTLDYEQGLDAKMFDNKAKDAYLLIENDDTRYVINNIPSELEGIELPLGVVLDEEEEVSFAIDALEDFHGGVYLLDNELSTLTNITNNSHTLKLASGEYTDRFSLLFKEDENLGNDTLDNVESVIYADNGELHVVLESGIVSQLSVYNYVGKELINEITSNDDNSSSMIISTQGLSSQIYLVKVKTEKGTIIKKIFIE